MLKEFILLILLYFVRLLCNFTVMSKNTNLKLNQISLGSACLNCILIHPYVYRYAFSLFLIHLHTHVIVLTVDVFTLVSSSLIILHYSLLHLECRPSKVYSFNLHAQENAKENITSLDFNYLMIGKGKSLQCKTVGRI